MKLQAKRDNPTTIESERSSPITVFLDIDGPIATSICWGVDCDNKWGWYLFDPRCVEVLNRINGKFNISWVLSSTWRLHGTIEMLNEYFKFRGLNVILSDTTSIINFSDPKYFYFEGELGRESLIREYIIGHGIEKYLIIDDLDMDFEEENMVFILDDQKGLSEDGTEEELEEKLNNLSNDG